MIKTTIKKIISKAGYKKLDKTFTQNISKDPLNSSLHLQFAIHCHKKNHPFLALAELKTAQYLGANVQKYKDKIVSNVPSIEKLNHNQYFRLKALASELNLRSDQEEFSVLDVGGGMGQLAAFLPKSSYCLVEPNVNGISGTNLPFQDKSFDFVVSCHVLEHIPVAERQIFLDQLLSKSRHGLILLNPFHIKGSNVDDRLKLVIEITGAEWAKEHLECSLPDINDIKAYAHKRKLQISIKPNGTMTTSLALVFVDYFANRCSSFKSDYDKINNFFNLKLNGETLDSEKFPNSYIVYLYWPDEKCTILSTSHQ